MSHTGDEHAVLPLPELPENQKGTSTVACKNYTASVSNAAGYLCHIHVDCQFNVPPELIFAIFCHPDNAGAFRDIKRVGYRKVKSNSPGLKVVEVEQCGELRVLWITRVFRTYLDVTEDSRDPECLKTDFTLLRSDLLSRFHGSWELNPKRDGSGKVVGCHAVLNQDVLPKGVPSFFAHLPVLGGMLRRVSLNTIQRLMEDILNIVNKYTAAGGKMTLDDVMAKIASERGHKTHAEENRPGRLSDQEEGSGEGTSGSSSDNNNNGNSKVTSFAIDSFSDSESEAGEPAAEEKQLQGDKQQEEQQQGHQQVQQEGSKEHAAAVLEKGSGAAAGFDQQGLASAGGSGELPSGASSARVSADGVVTAVLVRPVADGAASNSKGATEGVEGSGSKQHSMRKHHSRKHHKVQVEQGAPAVGVLLDVTIHGNVHLGLIANPDAQV